VFIERELVDWGDILPRFIIFRAALEISSTRNCAWRTIVVAEKEGITPFRKSSRLARDEAVNAQEFRGTVELVPVRLGVPGLNGEFNLCAVETQARIGACQIEHERSIVDEIRFRGRGTLDWSGAAHRQANECAHRAESKKWHGTRPGFANVLRVPARVETRQQH
jgi:hypothetical protein